MSPYNPPDPAAQALQILALLSNIKGQNQDIAQQRLKNALDIAQPGTTFGQLGLGDKDLKRTLGRVPKGDEVAKVLTPEYVMQQRQLDLLSNAPPDLVNTLAATTLFTKAGAPSAVYTAKGGVDVGKANEAAAGTRRAIEEGTSKAQIAKATSEAQAGAAQAGLVADAVNEGVKAWSKFSPMSKSLIGQKAALGTTESETIGSEVSTQLKTALQREALKATVDPSHPANALFKSLGIAPQAGIAFLGMGAEQLLNVRAELFLRLSTAEAEKETALQKADAEVAGEMGKKLGVSASSVMREFKNLEAGKAPNSDLGKAIQAGIGAVRDASIAKAIEEGDPTVQALSALQQGALKLGEDPKLLEVYSKAINRRTAEMMLRQRGVERPLDPQQLSLYNKTADDLAKTLSTFTSSGAMWWKRVNFLAPSTQNPVQSQNDQPIKQPNTSQLTPEAEKAAQDFMKALGVVTQGTQP